MPARVAAPAAPLSRDHGAADQPAGPRPAPAPAADASGQLAGSSGTPGSSLALAGSPWSLAWQQQRQPQSESQQQRWFMRNSLVLAGPVLAFDDTAHSGFGASSAGTSVPAAPPSAAAASAAASDTASDSGLGVQVNEPPPRRPQQQAEQLGAPSSGGGGGPDPDQQDFFANVGDAIRTLREDYPLLFVKNLNCECVADIAKASSVFVKLQCVLCGSRSFLRPALCPPA